MAWPTRRRAVELAFGRECGLFGEQDLHGTWILREICDLDAAGKAIVRGYPVDGRLVYTPEGDVFVGLGYFKPDGYVSHFYVGKYFWSPTEGQVLHQVLIASDADRLGKTLTRSARRDGERLILEGFNHLGTPVRLSWTK